MGKGGGGAGQVLFKTGHSISAGSYTFYIGNGGAGSNGGGGGGGGSGLSSGTAGAGGSGTISYQFVRIT